MGGLVGLPLIDDQSYPKIATVEHQHLGAFNLKLP
jgi:hypothetical protein